MKQKSVLLGISGGIAAYKAASLCSLLVKQGFDVQVLMTEHATKFIQPITFQALTKRPVVIDTFVEPDPSEIAHIAMADRAALYIIAPATANMIAKLAHGLADDMVSTTALAVTAPIIVAPAMNVHMLDHPTVQANIALLKARGVIVIDPSSGPLACGYTGKGRLPEPEDIMTVILATLALKKDLTGLRVVVSAGPTVEDIDPVRYLSNSSTGKMGYAIAAAAVKRGATVTLVSGPTQLTSVTGAEHVAVRSTEDMLHAVAEAVVNADVFISAAAPADFRPKQRLEQKWKKANGIPQLELESTPDILKCIAEDKKSHQTYVGFAAETQNVIANGQDKLARKRLDLLVANDITEKDAGFGVDTNRVSFVYPNGRAVETLPLMSKKAVADEILTRVLKLRTGLDHTGKES